MIERLFVCYIAGLDFRRVNGTNTPYIASLFPHFPWMGIRSVPSSDYLPIMLTGLYPPEHGMEIRIKSNVSESLICNLLDRVPEGLTTTFQCLIHLFNSSYDLATVPFWRRRRLEINRTRYISKEVVNLLQFDGNESIFKILGENNSRYVEIKGIDRFITSLDKMNFGVHELVMMEDYSVDLLQHWYLDDMDRIIEYYKFIDHFFKILHIKLQKRNYTLMLLSDHGQEPIKGTVDIISKIKSIGLHRKEYTYYVEAYRARFWFHTDRARGKISEVLSTIENGVVLSFQDLNNYNLNFQNSDYGELFFLVDPGFIIFPHDFYHPLANLYLGMTDKHQRSRIFNPKHRGYHHYLPHNESEKGFMLLLDDSYHVAKQEAELIDFAPTVLKLLGYEKPDYMKGNCVFTN